MRSVKIMKMAKTGYIIMSLIFGVLGILMLIRPKVLLPAFAGVFGGLFLLFGVVKLIGYFSKDLFRLAFQYDLASGILLIVTGIIAIMKADQFVLLTGIVLGIYVLADGLLKIQIALDARTFGIEQWWLILIMAVLTGITGVFLIFYPCEGTEFLMMLLGICLLAEGILNLVTVLTAVRIIRHQQPDWIDITER